MNAQGYVTGPISRSDNQDNINDILNNKLNKANFKGGTFTQLGYIKLRICFPVKAVTIRKC